MLGECWAKMAFFKKLINGNLFAKAPEPEGTERKEVPSVHQPYITITFECADLG